MTNLSKIDDDPHVVMSYRKMKSMHGVGHVHTNLKMFTLCDVK